MISDNFITKSKALAGLSNLHSILAWGYQEECSAWWAITEGYGKV